MTSLKIIDIRSCSYRLPILLSPTSRVPVGYESIPAFVVRHPYLRNPSLPRSLDEQLNRWQVG
jgi:hypothetical protein